MHDVYADIIVAKVKDCPWLDLRYSMQYEKVLATSLVKFSVPINFASKACGYITMLYIYQLVSQVPDSVCIK